MTDPTGPEGPFIAIDEGRQGGDHTGAVLYWLGPDGTLYVLDATLIPMPYHTDCIYERLLERSKASVKPVGCLTTKPES